MMSIIQGINKVVFNFINVIIIYINVSGVVVQVNNVIILDIIGGNIIFVGMGVYILVLDVRIDGVIINVDGDGIFIISKRKFDGYEDFNVLMVNKVQVNLDMIVLYVDIGMMINVFIVLIDSIFEVLEVIKFGSKVVIQVNNMILIGDVVQSDMLLLLFFLSQGFMLIGSVDVMFIMLLFDDISQWNMIDLLIVGNLINDGDIMLGNVSGLIGMLLMVDNILILQDNSQINVMLDIVNSVLIIKVVNVMLDGMLNFSLMVIFVVFEIDEYFGLIMLIDL